MNLELIRKYEKEFLHMLHGGSLLSRVMTFDEDGEMYTIWYKVDDKVLAIEKWTSDYLFRLSDKECAYYKPQFVIDDEYTEFRKALAEGRHIQFFNTKERLYDSSKPLHTWQDTDTIRTHGRQSDYRIKPEEPKFKAGDWVTHIEAEKPWQITDNSLKHLDNRDLIKWEPKKGEVCIFWEEDSEYNRAIIGRLKQIISNGNYVMDYGSGYTVTYSKCMPFTGVVPPHMKD